MITETRTAHGLHWRYDHSPDEDPETWGMAKRVACTVAESEARATGKPHIVALTTQPDSYHVLASDDPALAVPELTPLYEITPESQCIRLHQ